MGAEEMYVFCSSLVSGVNPPHLPSSKKTARDPSFGLHSTNCSLYLLTKCYLQCTFSVNLLFSLLKLSCSIAFCPHSQRALPNSRSYAHPMAQLVRFTDFVSLFLFLGDDVTKYDFKHLINVKTSLAAFN